MTEVERLAHGITSLIQIYGYIGIFLAMVLESACIPLPSEVIMPFGGYLVVLGHLNFWGVVICGTLGNLVGSLIAYLIGRYGGRVLILKYGRFIRLSEHHLKMAENWFTKRGQSAVLIGRVLPIVRTFISLPAGVAQMPVVQFSSYTLIGSLPWVYMLTWSGTALGKGWEGINKYVHPLTYAVAAAIVITVATYVVKWLRHRQE
ncbi:DedA family protein [Alicyclobacillus fastidiosus]|uniref:DedA family protein n=1 Tax=Alicyclobacillus fastidiosus TaxID=392011 RepID=UPI0024E05F08|nr:DedA family protein [Alicyclobacillus fastidiosus]